MHGLLVTACVLYFHGLLCCVAQQGSSPLYHDTPFLSHRLPVLSLRWEVDGFLADRQHHWTIPLQGKTALKQLFLRLFGLTFMLHPPFLSFLESCGYSCQRRMLRSLPKDMHDLFKSYVKKNANAYTPAHTVFQACGQLHVITTHPFGLLLFIFFAWQVKPFNCYLLITVCQL